MLLSIVSLTAPVCLGFKIAGLSEAQESFCIGMRDPFLVGPFFDEAWGTVKKTLESRNILPVLGCA
jgi:hypothetical protein